MPQILTEDPGGYEDETGSGKRGPKPWSERRASKRAWLNLQERAELGDQKREFCNANKNDGGKCRQPAGFKTPHVGYGCCRSHGGNMPTAIKSAARVMLADMALAAGFTDQVDIGPEESLMMLVRIKAGEVRFFTLLLEQIQEEEGVEGLLEPSRVETLLRPLNMGKDGEDPEVLVEETRTTLIRDVSLWIKMRNESMRDLAKFSAMAISAGVAQRLVALEEKQAELIASSVMGILKDVGVTIDATVLPVVRKHLERLDNPAVLEAAHD